MPFDTRLDTDVAGSRFDAAFDGSTGAQFRTAGEFQPAAFSFEALERLATFGYRSHQLTCCACGEDHSGELLAHKISLAVAGSSVAGTAPQGGALSAPPGSPESQTFNLSGEVDGSTATAVTIAVGDIVNSQIEVSGDQDWFRINLQAGVTYEFRLDATGGTGLGDPFLEIMNASGVQLKTNDDGGTGLNSLLRFTPTASGTYYINAHGWIDTNGGTSTGSYALTTQALPPIPTWTIDQIAQYLANEDLPGTGPRWQTTTITYNIEDLNANEQVMAERALQMWSAASPLTFVRSTSASANIRFVNSVADDPNSTAGDTDPVAYARTSSSGNSIISSVIVISSNWTTLDPNAQAGWFDNYMQQTYIHEVGHALGLSHPGPYDGTAQYGTDNLFTNDNWAYTVMSYFDQLEVGHGNYRFVLGLQQADVAAIQLLYGTNPSGTFAGNTTFGFNSSAPGTNIDWSQFVLVQPEGTYRRPPAMTLYDTSGIDTINLSGFAQPQIVDLRPGTFSSLGDRPDPSVPHYVNVVAIAANTIIENVIGGSGNDTVTGNTANNTITFGAGADTFVYGVNGGADTITDFSVAQDRLDLTGFSSAIALAAFNGRTSSAGGTLLTFGGGQTILLQGVSTGQLAQSNLILSAGGPISTVTGTPNADTLYGTADADLIDGLAGSDVLVGLGGNDIVLGGLGNDTIYGDQGNDSIDGGDGIDILIGGAGDDAISGGNGDDYLYGDGGNDIMDGGAGNDVVIGGIGNDRLEAGSGFDYIYSGDGDDVLTASSGTNVLLGEAGNDSITGGTGRDYIYGGIGADTMLGGDDIDILIGEAGDDMLQGQNGNDYLYAGTGNDTLFGGQGVDFMLGEDGSDVLDGGTGVNYLYGGAGADVFVQNFQSGAGVDVISDFEFGVDRIRLIGSSLTSFQSIAANTSYNSANGFTVIATGGGNAIWLAGNIANQLSAANFEFLPSGLSGSDPIPIHTPLAEALSDAFDFTRLAEAPGKMETPIIEELSGNERWTGPQGHPFADQIFTDLGPHTFDFAERHTDGQDWHGA